MCPIALFSVFTKAINEINDVSFAITFKKMLRYAYFLLNVSLDMLIKKKHVFTDIENLKMEKSYVLFSAVSLLISDIL